MSRADWEATDETTASAAETISLATTFADVKYLHSVTAVWSAGVAPTTNETFAIELDSGNGATFDTVIASLDPAAQSATDVLWEPTKPLRISRDDQIKVTYANTDDLAIGVVVTMEPA